MYILYLIQKIPHYEHTCQEFYNKLNLENYYKMLYCVCGGVYEFFKRITKN